MSNQNAVEEEFLSDEDMFSPKKNKGKADAAPVADQPPGRKEHLVNKFKKLLTNAGIPPPPVPDFHVDHFLTLWVENQSFLWTSNDQGDKLSESDQQDDLGICLNLDRSCEEFEWMGQQVCERYISSETAVVTSTTNVKLTQSAKKRRKANGWGLSPRTRISYLTRRMTTFQKDNIASASNKTTQILISRSEPKKNSKKPEIKGKRALFLSPERSNKFQTPEQGKSRRLCRQLMNSSPPDKIPTTRSSEKRRCSRSLFSAKETNQQTKPAQQQPLSTQHRQKMLWAVSNALKCVKIRMNDPEFKNFAALLFKATYEKWKTDSQSTYNGDKKVSTSDAMLATAKSLVEGVTGRQMSPKSTKKVAASKCKTPVKSKRDENSPPSSMPSSAPLTPLGALKKIPDGADVFPLDLGETLAEKLNPGGILTGEVVTPKKLCRRLVVEESPLKSGKKRKRAEDLDRAEACSSRESSMVLRNRTPAKATTPVKNSPNAKRPKLDPSPLKSLTPSRVVRQSPRLKNRTPSKLEMGFCSPTRSTRAPLQSIAQNTPEKSSDTQSHRIPASRALTSIEESPPNNVLSATPFDLTGLRAVRESPRLLRNRTPSKVIGPEATDRSPRKLRNRTPSKSTVLVAELTGDFNGSPSVVSTYSKSDGVASIARLGKASPDVPALAEVGSSKDKTSFEETKAGSAAEELSCSKKSSPVSNRKKSPMSSTKTKPPKLVAETDRRRLERRCSIDPPILTREKTPPVLEFILSDWASPIEELTMKRRRSSGTPQESQATDRGGSCTKRPLSLAASRRSSD